MTLYFHYEFVVEHRTLKCIMLYIHWRLYSNQVDCLRTFVV